MYYVYVLASTKTKWTYVGYYMNNLRRRFEEHQAGLSEYTSHRGPWRLAYYEAYASKADAMEREKILKLRANTLGILRKRITRSLESVRALGAA